jgi:protein-export membrane protein SecD
VNKIRVPIIIIVLIITLAYLIPTIGKYTNIPDWLLKYLPDRVLRLGLDLKGGTYLVYEVDTSNLPETDEGDAVNRALEIIRNRVDEFGVSEPSIQKQGDDKIAVRLPGSKNPDRAKNLIGQTAMLEFKLLAPGDELIRVIENYDDMVIKEAGDQPVADTDLMSFWVEVVGGEMLVYRDDYEKVMKMIEKAKKEGIIPREYAFYPGDLYDDPESRYYKMMGGPCKPIFLLQDETLLTGGHLKSARVAYDQFNQPIVSFEMDSEGGKKFGKITGAHIGERLAIVLDGVVKSAPNINSRITNKGMIEGSFSYDEAADLALVLRTGALPAPVRIVYEQVIGPSLGRDSIRNGIWAAIIGLVLVMLFMFSYYNLSGLLANLALVFNMIIVFAVLIIIRATLTLPGIAGFILSTAMAVDANVLIYERIREELDVGKTVKSAVDSGYRRAFVTILDSNLTTIIAGVVLYFFGTGPVRGFAITLIIGICASMFTAIVVTKTIYDFFLKTFKLKKISI